MAVIFDSSATIACLLPDERPSTLPTLAKALHHGPVLVPALWPSEVINAVTMAMRRGRIQQSALPTLFELLRAWPIQIEEASLQRVISDVLPIAGRYKLTVYDASYLELAQRRKLPLATLDDELRAAAKKAKVKLL